MVLNSIQNLGEKQYLNPQASKPAIIDKAAIEQQNQKAAETDINSNVASVAKDAFKLNISQAGEEMLKASLKADEKSNDLAEIRELKASYAADPIQKTSQIVNIIA